MKTQDNTISVIRMMAMLMIISCHILQGLNNNMAQWVNIGVQLFFFLSGFLYGKKKIKDASDFYKKRLKKILIPYIIVFIIAISLEMIVLGHHYPMKKIIGCLLGFGGIIGNISLLSHTWFVTYILICYLMLPILQNIFNKKTFKENFMHFLFIIFFLQLLQFFDLLTIDVCWINNFIFGYFYSKCCNTKKEAKIYETFMLVACLCILPFAIIYQENIAVTLPSFLNTYAIAIELYGHVFLGTVLFIFLYKIFKKYKIKENKVLKFSDKYSYFIYLVHQIFILNKFSLLFLTKSLILNIIIIFVCSFIAGVIIKYINDFIINIFGRLKKVNYDFKGC